MKIKLCRNRRNNQVTLTLGDKDRFLNGSLPVNKRLVRFAVKLRMVRLVLLEDVVDDIRQHPGDSNDSFLVPAPLFKIEAAAKDKRLQIGSTEFEAIQVRMDNAELFSLFNTQFFVHSSKGFLVSRFYGSGTK